MSTNRNNKNNKKDLRNAKNRTAVWPFIGGIATIAFSILLLTLRTIIPSLIIMLVGIFLIVY
ncbi:MAG TPA: hypothetical protein VFG45_09275 [Candidatus Nitrosocosmicus sp.]|nr:hypothetical protein [Candidatus Nitrosocosmicus sp.]